MKSLSRVQLFATLWTVATRLLCPWDSPGKNTGVGCHFLLQGIFLTQGSNPSLASSALAGGSLPLCHLGSPLMIQIYDFGFWKNPMFNLISHFPTSNECQKKRGYLELRRSLGQGVGRASQLVLVVNNLSANSGDARCGSDPWHGKIPWRRKWQPTPVFLPEKLHRQRSLVGYSPWGHIKLDVTEYACPARWYRESDQSS